MSADLRQVDPVEVDFGRFLQLAGVRVEVGAAGITLRLHWRALAKTTRPWRCFVHVLAGRRQISSLDHEILRGCPPIPRWEQHDEGYESLRLWLADPPPDLRLRMGLYDPGINVRAAVLRSTLAVTDESSAVWLEPNHAGGPRYAVCFEPVPLEPCEVVFEHGVELAACSVSRCGDLLWLRLKWILRRDSRPRGRLRFFGHLVPEPLPETAVVAQFDQDLPLEDTGPVTAVEQNVIRAVPGVAPAWLRAGLFRPSNLRRLRILRATPLLDEGHRCAYLALPAGLRP